MAVQFEIVVKEQTPGGPRQQPDRGGPGVPAPRGQPRGGGPGVPAPSGQPSGGGPGVPAPSGVLANVLAGQAAGRAVAGGGIGGLLNTVASGSGPLLSAITSPLVLATAGTTAAVVALGASARSAQRAMGPLGLAVTGMATAINPVIGILTGPLASSLKGFGDVIRSQTERLASRSAILGQQLGVTRFREEQRLIRRAERLGPDLAALEDLRSRFAEVVDRGNLAIEAQLLRLATSLQPVGEQLLLRLDNMVQVVEGNPSAIFEFLLDRITPSYVRDVKTLVKQLIKWREEEDAVPEDPPARDPVFEALKAEIESFEGRGPLTRGGRPFPLPGILP